jgi:tRNA dimethylallyltransferase
MDIGTAKSPPEIRQRIPHHLIDVVDPDEEFSAARFQAEADRAIQKIDRQGKIPFVVGGTGLYIRALTRGLFKGPRKDEGLRTRLRQEAQAQGVGALHKTLEQIDPGAAERIHLHDLFRIIRALEVYYLTGVPISRHQEQHGFSQQRYKALYIGLAVDRWQLYQRINARVDEMMEQGLVHEVEDLLNRGYGLDLSSMQAIGYRHIGKYLLEECSLHEVIATMKRDSRHYARRQMTWFRRMPEVRWIKPQDEAEIFEEIERHFIGISSHS